MAPMLLVMMVKDEAATIEKTLRSVPWVDDVMIVDTGDGSTLEAAWPIGVLSVHCGRMRWPGRFDDARNAVLNRARVLFPDHALLLLDGDETWEGPPPTGPGRVLLSYDAPGMGWAWWHHRVLPAGCPARYVGAVHEVLTGPDLLRTAPFVGRVRCAPPRIRPGDAAALADGSLRSVFYRAMTAQRDGKPELALRLFWERARMGATNVSEHHEVFESLLRVKAWGMAVDLEPDRPEPYYMWAEDLLAQRRIFAALDTALELWDANLRTMPEDFLFVWEPTYSERVQRDLVIRMAVAAGDKETAVTFAAKQPEGDGLASAVLGGLVRWP